MDEDASKRRKVDVEGVSAATPKRWLALISEMRSQPGMHGQLRKTLESALDIWPRSAELWVTYIEHHLALEEFSEAEKLFARSLPICPDIRLWMAYLGYVRRIHTGKDDETAETIVQAYEYALKEVQHDTESGKIWAEYLDFLESRPATVGWQAQHRMDETRKAYKRAVSLPISGLEQLWRRYDEFEQEISRATAAKFIGERAAAYMRARQCLQRRVNLAKGIHTSTIPPEREFEKNGDDYRDQIAKWRALVKYELTNPLQLPDPRQRILWVYRRASLSLQWCAEWWFEAAQFCAGIGEMVDEAFKFLDVGLKTSPTSFLLTARLSDIYEFQGKLDKVDEVWRSLIKHSELPTIAYCELMRATYRLSGLGEARKISSECRKQNSASFQIYTASADLELMAGSNSVANKIYEIANRKFASEPNFVRAYLVYLINQNDRSNANVLFEKAVATLSPMQLRPIFDSWLRYEADRGDAISLARSQQRYIELYRDADPVEVYSRRFSTIGADPVGAELHLQPSAPVESGPSIPESVVALAEQLPPAYAYDGPEIILDKLLDLVVSSV